MTTGVLKDFILKSKDGEWGKGEEIPDSVAMRVIRGTDFESIRVGDLSTAPLRHIPRRIAKRKCLEPYDIIIETAGGSKNRPTGRTIMVKPSLFRMAEHPLTCASFSRFIRINPALADPRYMFWYLQHLYTAGFLHQYHTQHTGVARFQWTTFAENEELRLPVRETQRKIASVLGAYDDLIENNTRRIAILEEMARAIYREWFVEFRFPGHEQVGMVDSELGPVPEGWEVVQVEELCEFVSRGVTPKYSEGSGRWIINQKANRGSSLQLADLKELHPELRVPPEKHAQRGDLLVNCLGEGTLGRVHYFTGPSGEWAVDQHMSICRSSKPGVTSYLYEMFASPQGQHRIQAAKTGATNMTMFNISRLRAFLVAFPGDELVAGFHRLTTPIRQLRQTLSETNEILRRTRDLLLPKLISGEIDVSEAEEELEAAPV